METKAETVLIVDDDDRCRQLHELWLCDEFEVQTASTGWEALEEIDGNIDVVVLDRQIPGLSGSDVYENIREGAFDPGVVMVSTLQQGDVDPDAYLRKPVTSDVLIATVTTVADRMHQTTPVSPKRRGI